MSASLAPGPLLVAYGVLAVAASARSVEQLATKAAEAPFAYGLSAVAAVVYVVAWQALRLAPRNQGAARIARFACSVELVGVLSVGIASIGVPSQFAHPTVWSGFGSGYGFAPLVLPFVALWWLSPRSRRGSLASPVAATAATGPNELATTPPLLADARVSEPHRSPSAWN